VKQVMAKVVTCFCVLIGFSLGIKLLRMPDNCDYIFPTKAFFEFHKDIGAMLTRIQNAAVSDTTNGDSSKR
jgi:hypothetical protein